MVNNIKLDEVNTFLDLHKSNVKATTPAAESAGVNVSMTNQMQHLVHLVKNDNSIPTQSKSLSDIKESIRNDTYHIDLDALSDKMISDGVIS